MTYIDLAYYLADLYYRKQNGKLIDRNKNIKIYSLYNDNVLIVTIVSDNDTNKIFIKRETDLEDIVCDCFCAYSKLNIDADSSIALEPCEFENFVIDEIENIYVTLLTEDHVRIVVDEGFFYENPYTGAILDKSFHISEDETNKRKIAIEEKFKKLVI